MSASVHLTFAKPVNLVGAFYRNTNFSLTYEKPSDGHVTYMTNMTNMTRINVDNNSVRSLYTNCIAA